MSAPDDARAREVLADPVAVHVNMLRGSIAKPSPANIWHLYGTQALLAAMPASASAECAATARAEGFAAGVEAGAAYHDCEHARITKGSSTREWSALPKVLLVVGLDGHRRDAAAIRKLKDTDHG